MNNSSKRVSAGVLALAMVAGTVPANVDWADLFGTSAIVAQADGSVTYLNENGDSATITDYTVLTGNENPTKYQNTEEFIELSAGTYVVNSKISYAYPIRISGDVKLIICDNASLSIGSESERFGYGISTAPGSSLHYIYNSSLSIYSQSAGQTQGKMSIYSQTPCISSFYGSVVNYNQYGGDVFLDSSGAGGFWCENGNALINGGKLTAIGDANTAGVYANNVSISGGQVTANGRTFGCYAKQSINISGGQVSAYGGSFGIEANHGNIILSLKNDTDYIQANRYYNNDESGHVYIAADKTLYAGTTELQPGTITDTSVLNGKKIRTFPVIHEFDAETGSNNNLDKWQFSFPNDEIEGKSIKKIEVLMDVESIAKDGWGRVLYKKGNPGNAGYEEVICSFETNGIKKYTAVGDLNSATWAGVELVGKGKLLAYTITYADNTTKTVGNWNYPEYTAPTAVTGLSYTGSAQALVTAGETTNGTMKYVVTDNTVTSSPVTGWTASVPTGKNADTYRVWYMVDGDAEHIDSEAHYTDVTIAPVTATVTKAPTAKNPVRENSPVQLINAGQAQPGCTIQYQLGTSATAVPTGEWTTDATQMTANSLGTYYVWYKATGDEVNYADSAPKCVTVEVTQAQLWTIEMPDYVYDGTAHEPTINGTAYGKLTYTYFTSAGICIGSTAPTEPGDYRVSVAASGDDTHPSKLESVEYTIKSAKFAAGNTVSFKEKVEFNFLVEATDAETVEGAYVLFIYDHYGEKMTVKKPINKDDKNGKYYRVRLPLTASEMAIDIKAELYLPTLDKPVDTKTRSIKDYAESAIKSNLDGAEVLKAMLNYGGYTQTALNNNTTLLANSGEGIAVDVSAVSPKSATPFVRPVSAQGAKVTYKGSTAMTVSDVYVRHYFAVDSSLTASELNAVKIKIGDKEVSFKELPKNSTGYYYDVAPQLAYELDKENDRIVVYGFAGAETADSPNAISIENYNVIDYCEAVANSDKQTTAAKNMAKALYSYYKAAKAYVDSRA